MGGEGGGEQGCGRSPGPQVLFSYPHLTCSFASPVRRGKLKLEDRKEWELEKSEGREGKTNSCSCQHGEKCKEINSYLKSKWGRGIRPWNANV